MATVNALHTMYSRMGLNAATATSIIDDQDFNSLEELKILRDDEITNLCRALRRPGGLIPNPNAAAGLPALIPNPGNQANLQAETNLKPAAYYLRHRERIGRSVQAADITVDLVRTMRALRDHEVRHSDPTEQSKFDVKKTTDSIEYIASH